MVQVTDDARVYEMIEQFRLRCKEVGLKVTPQRVAIYKALLESNEHPSAETVYRAVSSVMPSVSLDTVNRTLLTLAELGVAFVVEGSGDVRRYDACLEDHQHFRCIKCKRILDFHCQEFDNIETPEFLKDKCTVLRSSVYFEGLCNHCKEREVK